MSVCRTAWVPVSRAATFTGMSRQHVYRLAAKCLVKSRERNGILEVWFFDVHDHATRRERR